MLLRLLLMGLVLLVPVSASALDIYSVTAAQATIAPYPVPPGRITVFTLQGAPKGLAITANGVAIAALKDCAVHLLDAGMGWNLINCPLTANLVAGQVVAVIADDKMQVYRVTYGEGMTFAGLIRMWGLQRL